MTADPGSTDPHCRESYTGREYGNTTSGPTFFGVRGSKSFVDTLLLRVFPSDQKHSTRNNIFFAVLKYLALNVNSRGGKKRSSGAMLQNQGIRHIIISHIEVQFREITLYQKLDRLRTFKSENQMYGDFALIFC